MPNTSEQNKYNEQVQEPLEQAAQQMTDEETIQLTRADFDKVKAHIEDVQKEKEEATSSYKRQKKNLDKVKAQVAELQKEKDEAIAIAQRLHADFDNYRKRNATLRTDSYDEGKRDCMKALLPVLDNFDRALENAEGVDKGFVEGVSLVQRMLLDTLGKFGLEEIPADGAFDPNLHDAVMREQCEGKSEGEITAVLQKGYRVHEKILRHSMVKVAE